MSWDGYIDSLTGSSEGSITKATIIGLNGAIWTPVGAKPTVLEISQGEASSIGPIMNAKDDKVEEKFAGTGIVVGGTKYMFLRDIDGDGRIITGKKAGVGNIVMQSTTQAVIIAFTPDEKNHASGKANGAVDKMVKYLESTGY